MDKFDLKRALSGEKVRTKDGKEVKEIYFFETADESEYYPIRAVINGVIESYTIDGEYSQNQCEEDLIMAVDMGKKWFNAYKVDDKIWLGESLYNSEEEALKRKKSLFHFKTVSFDIE